MAEFNFLPAIRLSLVCAISGNPTQFEAFGVLRNHLEASFWHEAVALLTPEDHTHLRLLVQRAWDKLNGHPIQIPHTEHRDLHLTIFGRLNNPFVKGLLEAYWEGYEAVGLSVYSDYQYLREVWAYHADIVESIVCGDVEKGYQYLVQHTTLLRHRETPSTEAHVGEAVPTVALQP
jgi:DNA-binding FadR family transcriptional regulator